MRGITPIAVGAALLLSASALAQDALKTAVDGTLAPHAMPKLSGGIEGFNVDLADAIAHQIDKKIAVDAAQFSGLIPALQAGTYDFLIAPVERELIAIAASGATASEIAAKFKTSVKTIERKARALGISASLPRWMFQQSCRRLSCESPLEGSNFGRPFGRPTVPFSSRAAMPPVRVQLRS
jgi:hypothetical protein